MDKISPREALLKHGKWIGSSDFAKLIAKEKNVSERQAKTILRKAYRNNEVKRFVFPDRTVIYGLTEFGPPEYEVRANVCTKTDVENVRSTLEELRLEFGFFREPTIKEVALKSGMHPELVMSILYSTAPETAWREPDEHAEREAIEVINLAGWLGIEEKNELSPQLKTLCETAKSLASKEMRERAENILKHCPDLIPQITLTEIIWPKETKIKWHQLFGSEAPSPQYWVAGKGFVSVQEANNLPSHRQTMRIL